MSHTIYSDICRGVPFYTPLPKLARSQVDKLRHALHSANRDAVAYARHHRGEVVQLIVFLRLLHCPMALAQHAPIHLPVFHQSLRAPRVLA